MHIGALETGSASYISRYVTKKRTKNTALSLNGRWPEFSRMSNRPGLGVSALWEVADTLMKFNLETSQPDVPSALQHGRRKLPLGRFLRGKLREMVGKDVKAPDETLAEMAEQLSELYSSASSAPSSVRRELFKALIQEDGDQERANFYAKVKIHKPRERL